MYARYIKCRKWVINMNEVKKMWGILSSFTKIITTVWIVIWIESIICSQVATFFSFGDAAVLTEIVQSITTVGVIVCEFYFGKACVENVAKGIEQFLLYKQGLIDESGEPLIDEEEFGG